VRQQFITYISQVKRYSPHTVRAYQSDLEQFENYCRASYQISDFSSINHQIIRSWIVSLLDAGVSARSTNRKISSLKSFYKFLLKEGKITSDPLLKVIAPKSQKRLPEFIKENDLDTLLNSFVYNDDFEDQRNKLIIATFYLTGIRLNELIQIKTSDFNKNLSEVKILGKGNKQRIIPIPEFLKSEINKYLIIRNTLLEELQQANPYLFITRQGKQTYAKLVYRVINKHLAYVSTNSKKSPHTLRHSFATVLLNKGANLNAIKEILGHASLSATQVYTHNSIEQLKTIYKQAHPRA
jgi:integrase/recombinase XerC